MKDRTEYFKKYRLENREKIKENRMRDKEKYRKYHKNWYLKNKGNLKKYQSRPENKETIFKRRNRDNKLYATYTAIKSGLRDTSVAYKYYAGRGIKCLWKNYDEFKRDMYTSYLIHLKKYGRKNTTIDRIDNDGNYCKENCRWATMKVQNSNKRPIQDIVYLEYNGKKQNILDWSKELKIQRSVIYLRIEKGYSVDEIFSKKRIYKNSTK